MRKKAVTNQNTARHPVNEAFDEFRRTEMRVFEGSAHGVYLANRLEVAFQAGWVACERTVKTALGGGLIR